MRFLVDENLPCDFAISARERGLQALWVRDIFPVAKDQVILERLKNAREVLVTRDVRFAALVFNLMCAGERLPGVVPIGEQSLKASRAGWLRYLCEWLPKQSGITQARIRHHYPAPPVSKP